jgi:hypothetical protein
MGREYDEHYEMIQFITDVADLDNVSDMDASIMEHIIVKIENKDEIPQQLIKHNTYGRNGLRKD